MKNMRTKAFTIILLLAGLAAASVTAEAQRRNDREIRDAVRSLSTQIDNFEYDLRDQMRSSSANSTILANVSDDISNLKDQVKLFQNNYDRRRENKDDVNAIVDAARRIEDFLRMYPQNQRVTGDWSDARAQIDRLGSNYGVVANWSQNSTYDNNTDADQGYSQNGNSGAGAPLLVGLSGTYDLDTQRSESIDDIVSSSGATGSNREELRDKLTAPGQIALDIRGSQVTLASSTASPVSFSADGQPKTETDASGRTIRVQATLTGDKLVVSSLGGDTDYTITFTSSRNGQEMKVSRRITTPYLNQTVFAESVYNKTDSVARLGIDTGGYDNGAGYSDNTSPNSGGQYGNAPSTGLPRTGAFIVPNGTIVTGVLDSDINTKVSQNNDRFRMTVQSPDEFRGATVEGYISGVARSGKVTGRSNLTFNFERITLRDGRVFDFAGNLQSIRDQNGKDVKIDTEGQAQGSSQTKETAKRGGIGAGIGAVIGAIAGGVKGAAIGAIIGGGAGAGSVAIQGRDDIELMKGSTISVTSSSPIRDQPR